MAQCLAQGCPIDVTSCILAAGAGNIPVLGELYRREGAHCVRDSRVCAEAARFGHGQVLLWLRERGARWDWRTCDGLTRFGDLEALRWAISAGCPVSERSFATAASMLHRDPLSGGGIGGECCEGGLEYRIRQAMELIEGSASFPRSDEDGRVRVYQEAVREAARRGRFGIVGWLLSRVPVDSFTGTSYCDAAAEGGCVATLRLLVERYGLACGSSASAIAAASCNFDALSYCLSVGSGWRAVEYEEAKKSGQGLLEKVLTGHGIDIDRRGHYGRW